MRWAWIAVHWLICFLALSVLGAMLLPPADRPGLLAMAAATLLTYYRFRR